MPKIIPAVLCGGSGTRLWPLSRENHPKQFVDLGNGRTLFGDTMARLGALEGAVAPICVCAEKYRFYAAPQVEKAGGMFILEPCARSTAPAIALAAFAAAAEPDALLLALPADHYFGDAAAFANAVAQAAPLAEAGRIVTFGIRPSGPATGFGYIHAGARISGAGCEVLEFVEKPEQERARAMLAAGGYYWNAGIFLMRPRAYLAELEAHAPRILRHCREAWEKRREAPGLIRPMREAFEACPSDSIDYAVMERAEQAAVMPLDVEWNDLGSWQAFYENAARDERGNAAEGRALLKDVKDCYIHGTGRLVAAIGVENLAIVETPDAVLVADRGKIQGVRSIVATLKGAGAGEYRQHRLVHRPWGTYEILSAGDRFQVKRIVVKPGHALSLQKHHHRAEHWIIVSGTAEVVNGDSPRIYAENESTYIPIGTPHKLSNPGLIPLVIIEIQSGSYLGEDDIIRLEDRQNPDLED